jgi:hypothetical protein
MAKAIVSHSDCEGMFGEEESDNENATVKSGRDGGSRCEVAQGKGHDTPE